MNDLITALLGTPIPTLLVVGGIVFIFLSIFPIKIIFRQQKPSPKQQILSAIVGIILLSGGIFLSASAAIQSATPIPTETPLPLTSTATVVLPLSTIEPTPSQSASIGTEGKIAITEVMAAPCGGTAGPSKNEYIELYNYGTGDVDVNGWWIATNNGGEGGAPDQLTSWGAQNPGIPLGENVIINTTVIPPSRFAIVLSPIYYTGEGTYHMPYIFPKGTIILTLVNSKYLGNDNKGLLGSTSPLSVLVLYKGSQSLIDEVISTYGTPSFGASVGSVKDDGLDNIPLKVGDCTSIERIIASAPDVQGNWETVLNGNPGQGSYSH